MEALVKWSGKGVAFNCETPKGHKFVLSGPAALNDGEDLGPTPIEMLLHCAAACTSVDTIVMLQARGAEIIDYEVQVEGQRAELAPKPIKNIQLTYNIKGKNLTDEMVQEVLDIAFRVESGVVNTYNSQVTWSFKITHV